MRALKWIGGILLGLVAIVGLLFLGARFSDGPIAIIPGGPLVSGELIEHPVGDWSFARSVETIELQLSGENTSRTTWILVHEGRAFIPCSLGFPPGKRWHFRADQDGRAVVRIEDKRYPVMLRRLAESTLEPQLKSIVESKYGGAPGDSGTWFFAIEGRAS